MSEWESLAGWWSSEVASDPAYASAVIPLVDALCPPEGLLLEIGCGEGQVLRGLDNGRRRIVGLELNPVLAGRAARDYPVIQARLPDLRAIRSGAVDVVAVVLVLEHIADLEATFTAIRSVVRPQGELVVVVNHPVLTAPGAAAVVDPTDGEIFWRWGNYLDVGATQEPAGAATVTFFHRPLSHILTAAGGAGWSLVEARETAWDTDDADSPPRLVGLRWRALGSHTLAD